MAAPFVPAPAVAPSTPLSTDSGGRRPDRESESSTPMSTAVLLKEGVLQKRGHLVPSWKKRWFRLTTSELTYGDLPEELSEGSPEVSDRGLRGVIFMSEVSSVVAVESRGMFEIRTVTGRDYAILASSDEERDEWIQAVDRARFGPSPLTSLLRETSELLREGAIDVETRDEIRDALINAGESAVERIGERVRRLRLEHKRNWDVAAAAGPGLVALKNAETEQQMVDALSMLQRIVRPGDSAALSELANSIVRDCQAQFEKSPERLWTPVVENAYVHAVESIRAALDADDDLYEEEEEEGGGGDKEDDEDETGRPSASTMGGEDEEGDFGGDSKDEEGPVAAAERAAARRRGRQHRGASSASGAEDGVGMDRPPAYDPMRAPEPSSVVPPLPTPEDFARLSDPGKFEDRYDTGEVLGRGGYSIVHKAKDVRTGTVAAAKFISKERVRGEQQVLRSLYREVLVGKVVRHDHVVQLLGFWEEADRYVLVSEFMGGGELFDRIVTETTYSEAKARDVVKALADAIAYLHERGIAHRDLKPENILLSSADPDAPLKLADMGFASEVPPGGLKTPCGTPSYVAPEILSNIPYGCGVDCWSLGVIAFILLCGYAPFAHQNQAELFRRIKSGKFYFDRPYWTGVSSNAKDLIRKLLTVDPTKRITAAEILVHPWVTGTVGSAALRGVADQMRAFNSNRRRPLKTGLLVKQGRFIQNWRERSFVLYGDSLEYFDPELLRRNPPMIRPKGSIPLESIIELRQLARPGVFRVYARGGRDLIVQAPDGPTATGWVRAISAQKAHHELMNRAQQAMREDRHADAVRLIKDASRYDHYILRRGHSRSQRPTNAEDLPPLPAIAEDSTSSVAAERAHQAAAPSILNTISSLFSKPKPPEPEPEPAPRKTTSFASPVEYIRQSKILQNERRATTSSINPNQLPVAFDPDGTGGGHHAARRGTTPKPSP